VSVWYFTAALCWTALNYIIGNFVPQYLAPGAAGAAVSSMYIHDLVGLLVTPLGWGLMYYMVPVALQRPVYSHRLSLIGFWMLAFFYPLNSAHHYRWSPIPLWVQHAAVVASVGVHVVIYTVAWNFIASAWGTGGAFWHNLPLRYFYTGVAYYLLTCVQCAIQVQLSVQSIIHFSDWVVGHAHFVMFGAFGMWVLAFSQMIWPKLVGAEKLHSRGLMEAHWWLSTLGMGFMWVDLTAVGLIEGFNWEALNLFTTSVRAAMPFWLFRTLAGVTIALGQVLLFWNLFRTWLDGLEARARSGEPAPAPAPAPAVTAVAAVQHGPRRRYETASFVLIAAGAGSYLFALVTLGLMPFIVKGHLKVNVVTPAAVPAELAGHYRNVSEYKSGLLLGRDIYVAENCWNCHTQFVRPVGNEVARYGPVATLEEYQNDMNLPQLFGTRRVGPDLSREHGKHSNDWHYAHLFEPRLVVPESVMPSYPWLFERPRQGEPIKPNERGVALVAYLQWLGTAAAAEHEHDAEVNR
jgi:cbb3-type cytochrome oxidase cytochrome c subunit